MNKKLEVKNLKISFKTMNGKVQAVRDISFDLYEGDTLAIVGESGSGKSVTSKAILGILAGNSIIEGGEIIYDGKNLLNIPEDEFHKIRGDKIAMIFQDPLSSLNPIMRIGRQLTEAMLLKGKARQRESRITFNNHLRLLKENMFEAIAKDDESKKADITLKCNNFDKFEYKHLALEGSFNKAFESCENAILDIENIAFKLEKKAADDLSYTLRKIKKEALQSIHTYVVDSRKDELVNLVATISSGAKDVKKNKDNFKPLVDSLNGIKDILVEAKNYDKPNFFSMGYYLTFSKEPLPNMPVEELNKFLRTYLDDNFMLDFINDAKLGLINSASKALEYKKEFVSKFDYYKEEFLKENLVKEETDKLLKEIKELVNNSIDRLETIKDSIAYTMSQSLKADIDQYYSAISKNKKEQVRFNGQTIKYEKMVKGGRTPEWKVAPLSLIDLVDLQETIVDQIERLKDHYVELISKFDSRDFDSESISTIDFLKENASGVVNKITPQMARNKAITLMEEVGISEPRRRYYQYPFEFSGGMRQRIVIAIALAANPDILICDEPTTALDVTIQAQILELINKLKAQRKLAIIFITHDLGVVANMADRIAVMYAGKIVEYGTSEDIFYDPRHPYTWALLSSMPDLDTNDKLEAIPGTPPNMIYPPKGDAFAERNKYALKVDFELEPPMFEISETHSAATWLLHENAPKIKPPKIVTERIERMKKVNAEYLKKSSEKGEK